MMMTSDVLFEEIPAQEGVIGVITLNRPRVLNSLNHDMIRAMLLQLRAWAKAAMVKAVVIRAVPGRAFCAGGDIRLTHEKMVTKHPGMMDFFRDEYQLNQCIYHYPKPYVALLDGITMGGGAGISIHGSHRIATEHMLFAMPETGIGFFPDVGGTYFLPRMGYRAGYYLGLTGAKITADECVQSGIAHARISHDSLPDFLAALTQLSLGNGNDAYAAITDVLARFRQPVAPHSALLKALPAIQQCFSGRTVEEIIASLMKSDNILCQEAAVSLQKKSPTSLKVTLAALDRGVHLTFDRCMEAEYCLAEHFLHGHDFSEGIRAVIIDKDQQPQWKPDSLQAVDLPAIEAYFKP